MRRSLSALLIFSLTALVCHGCHTPPSPEELGTVVFEIPQVPGADQPYPLPELDPPPLESTDQVSDSAEPE